MVMLGVTWQGVGMDQSWRKADQTQEMQKITRGKYAKQNGTLEE